MNMNKMKEKVFRLIGILLAVHMLAAGSMADIAQAEKLKTAAVSADMDRSEETADDPKGGTDDPKGGTDDPKDGTDTDDPKDDTDADDPKDDTDDPKDDPKDDTDTDDPKDDEEKPKLAKPNLKAASKPDGGIKLSWNKVNGAAEYVLYRSTQKDKGFKKAYKTTGTKAGTRSYIDTGRTAGKVYYYRLTVFSKGRAVRADSKTVKGRSLGRAQLTGISNTSGSKKLVLQWETVKGAAGYQIERKSGTKGYQLVASVKGNKTSYTDKKCSGGTIYTYRVCAKDDNNGRGNYSKPASQMAIDAGRKMIALTYDDGPSQHTPIVLNALEKYGAHATFFVVGNRVNQFSSSIRREAAIGCEIGNHTYAHNSLTKLSASQVRSVLQQTNQAVKKQTGIDIRIMRPPGGGYNSSVCAAVGMPLILWSVDTLDWKTRSTSATIQCVKQQARDGAVILMHDLHQPTAAAADAVIGYLKAAGYQMVTVSELAAYRGGMRAGKVYSQFQR